MPIFTRIGQSEDIIFEYSHFMKGGRDWLSQLLYEHYPSPRRLCTNFQPDWAIQSDFQWNVCISLRKEGVGLNQPPMNFPYLQGFYISIFNPIGPLKKISIKKFVFKEGMGKDGSSFHTYEISSSPWSLQANFYSNRIINWDFRLNNVISWKEREREGGRSQLRYELSLVPKSLHTKFHWNQVLEWHFQVNIFISRREEKRPTPLWTFPNPKKSTYQLPFQYCIS